MSEEVKVGQQIIMKFNEQSHILITIKKINKKEC